MRRHKSFAAFPFYLVATPIGNLSEFSPRALSILNEVDFICAEDTRTSGLLLSHFNIKKPLVSVHKFNEVSRVDFIINKLRAGEKGAFLSDAGYPLVSDPGASLVKALINEGLPVSVINGPSAFLPALVASGLQSESFIFLGFLSGNNKEIISKLNTYKDYEDTLLFYEAPHRVTKTIETLYHVLGDRRLVIARELTKMHEEYIYTSLQEFVNNPLPDLKGELVLVVAGASKVENDFNTLLHQVDLLMTEKGYSTKEATSVVALLANVSKNKLYEAYLKR